jgi:hypothetical protein
MHLSLQDHVALGGMLILIAALALSLGGVSLVFYRARMTREAVSKRVDLVRGKDQHRGAGSVRQSAADPNPSAGIRRA